MGESTAVAPTTSTYAYAAPPLSPTKATTAEEKPFALIARLSTGETLGVKTFASKDDAISRGTELATEIENGAWPLIEGRLVDPEAVLALEVEANLTDS
jgi:hypothetical protein